MKEIKINNLSITTYTDGYPINIAISNNFHELQIRHYELDNLIYALEQARKHIKSHLVDYYK
jgi:hypothetical protein